ncbi:MAG: methyltransferase type 11 [Chloroflexota bacterium]
MDPQEYRRIAQLEARHWWYRGMAEVALGLLEGVKLPRPALILDAGCGPGGTSARFKPLGRVVGLDLAPEALNLARHHLAALVRGSVTALPFSNATFDLVLCFDVIYHLWVGDDRLAVKELGRVLKPGGYLLIRVPALEALRGPHDQVVLTRHRYTARELENLVRSAGLEVARLTYANFFLFPPAALWRLAGRLIGPARKPASDVRALPAPLNGLLYQVLRLEGRLMRRFGRFPIGLSLICLAYR